MLTEESTISIIEVQGWRSPHLVQREHFGRALSHFLFRDLQISQANVGCWLGGLIPVSLIVPMGRMETAILRVQVGVDGRTRWKYDPSAAPHISRARQTVRWWARSANQNDQQVLKFISNTSHSRRWDSSFITNAMSSKSTVSKTQRSWSINITFLPPENRTHHPIPPFSSATLPKTHSQKLRLSQWLPKFSSQASQVISAAKSSTT